MKTTYLLIGVIVLAVLFLGAYIEFRRPSLPLLKPETLVVHPEWSRTATIYEVNIRQYSKEGTLKAFEKDLPRLKKLGVDLLWIMPVQPIGEKNRKEPLGSYYSVKDYYAVNPAFGTMDDFKSLVKRIHELGMYVVLDWVPNHSSWDNPWVTEHPEFYEKDTLGKMVSPFDWTDVVKLDYKNKDMRKAMLDAMKWWLTETNIDGFRCDVAHMVPVDFWNDTRKELDKLRKIFFLAESDQPFLHEKSYDATYDWKFHHIMNDIAQGKKNANAVEKHFAWVDSIYPYDSYLLEFTSNHDENSWAGTEYERMGQGAKTFAALTFTLPGIPLIYNGQEVGFNRRLKFFEKDSIDWKESEMFPFYQKLIALKKTNKALRNGDWGGKMERINTSCDSTVYAFTREAQGDKVFFLANVRPKAQNIKLKGNKYLGSYTELFTGKPTTFAPNSRIELKPWEYLIFIRKK